MHFADGVVMFDFRAVCDGPRSQTDYMEISRLYHTVLIANVEQMGQTTDDIARRFIAMVDEFYERNVKLIMSAEVSMETLYLTGQLNFEFRRCLSRLNEMQSHAYLASQHVP
jgi:cell division protein ZapE